MTYTRHLSYAWMKSGGEYDTFLVFCAAQYSSPTDHTAFLPALPRPVVDRTNAYPPMLTTLGSMCGQFSISLILYPAIFICQKYIFLIAIPFYVLYNIRQLITQHTQEGRRDGTHQ